MKKIALAEDNSFLALAIEEKLRIYEDFEVIYKARNGKEIYQQMEQGLQVDLILMDIQMPIMDGIEATRKIKDLIPELKIVMLTVMDNDESIIDAIQAGADGYLLKDINAVDLRNGILETLSGGASMTPSIALKTLKLLRESTLKAINKENDNFELTTREIQVLEQLATGLPNKLIAENLFISSSTVGKHIENIYAKLKVHSRIEAVMKAKKNSII